MPPDFQPVSRNIAELHQEKFTLGERLADRLASFAGSWGFIIGFLFLLVLWMAFNELTSKPPQFDPFPFILLNLVLSCMAAIQAPVIMMSQNRQSSRDRLRDEEDFEVNVKAEKEVARLNHQLRHLRNEVAELHVVILQQCHLMNELPGRQALDETEGAGEE